MLSTGMDLTHSLIAALSASKANPWHSDDRCNGLPTPEHEADLLTAALIWHDRVRSRASSNVTVPLCFLLPGWRRRLTAHRLRWLRDGITRATSVSL